MGDQTTKKPGVVSAIFRELGVGEKDKEFLRDTVIDTVKVVAKEGVKEQLFGKSRKKDIPITKVHKYIDAFKDGWWLPAAIMGSMMFVMLGIKWFFKMLMG
ncbi:hypothetical protein KAR91_44280 [Candidatus Pacearchaeota archaeon]|nr:hypothetical protein [Candidatus Pacearchaeota archaeon]